MTTGSFAPRGTELQHSPDGITYTTIAQVLKIQRTGSKADLAETTNMDTPTANREYLATLLTPGEISFECNFLPGNATQQVLKTDYEAQTNGYYKVVLVNSLGNATFNAFVASDDWDLPIEKQGTKSIKLAVTGAITVTW